MFGALFIDPVGLLVQLFFAATIVMMILDSQKPPLVTSIPTGIALVVLGFSFTSPVVGVLSAANGILWLVLAVQRYMQR